MSRILLRRTLTLIAITWTPALSAQSGVTIANPRPRPITMPPAVATPALAVPAASFLQTGSYQLRLYVVPDGDSTQTVTRTLDVQVTTSGNAVTITSDNPKDTLRGTMHGSSITASGSSAGISMSIAATATAAGATGSFVAAGATNTVSGSMALTRAYRTQLHKIETYGTKAPAATADTRTLWQKLKDWLTL